MLAVGGRLASASRSAASRSGRPRSRLRASRASSRRSERSPCRRTESQRLGQPGQAACVGQQGGEGVGRDTGSPVRQQGPPLRLSAAQQRTTGCLAQFQAPGDGAACEGPGGSSIKASRPSSRKARDRRISGSQTSSAGSRARSRTRSRGGASGRSARASARAARTRASTSAARRRSASCHKRSRRVVPSMASAARGPSLPAREYGWLGPDRWTAGGGHGAAWRDWQRPPSAPPGRHRRREASTLPAASRPNGRGRGAPHPADAIPPDGGCWERGVRSGWRAWHPSSASW